MKARFLVSGFLAAGLLALAVLPAAWGDAPCDGSFPEQIDCPQSPPDGNSTGFCFAYDKDRPQCGVSYVWNVQPGPFKCSGPSDQPIPPPSECGLAGTMTGVGFIPSQTLCVKRYNCYYDDEKTECRLNGTPVNITRTYYENICPKIQEQS